MSSLQITCPRCNLGITDEAPKVVIVIGRSGIEQVRANMFVDVEVFDNGHEFPDDENQREFRDSMKLALKSCPIGIEPEVINQDR